MNWFPRLALCLLMGLMSSSSQRLQFLNLPASMKLTDTKQRLSSDEIEPLISNLLGLPSPMDWSGLSGYTSPKRPKADVLFLFNGVETPKELGFADTSREVKLTEGQALRLDFSSLKSQLESGFRGPSLFVEVVADDVPVVETSSVNAVLAASVSAGSGLLKVPAMMQRFPPGVKKADGSLDVSSASVINFYSELGLVDLILSSIVEKKDHPDLVSLFSDETPDVFLFQFSAVAPLLREYEGDQKKLDRVKKILRAFIEDVSLTFKTKLYDESIPIELLTVPEQEEPVHVRVRRSAQEPSTAVDPKANNLAPHYDENYAQIFNISIWTSVFLAVVVYLVAYGMWNMDPGVEGIVYKMTTTRSRRDY